jgi:hypothetical protein
MQAAPTTTQPATTENIAPQILIELLSSDNKIRHSVEEAWISSEQLNPLYCAAEASCNTLSEFLEIQKKSQSSFKCQLLNLSFQFNQNILIEVFILEVIFIANFLATIYGFYE